MKVPRPGQREPAVSIILASSSAQKSVLWWLRNIACTICSRSNICLSPVFLLIGFGVLVLLTAWLPMVLSEAPLSLPIVCVALGAIIFAPQTTSPHFPPPPYNRGTIYRTCNPHLPDGSGAQDRPESWMAILDDDMAPACGSNASDNLNTRLSWSSAVGFERRNCFSFSGRPCSYGSSFGKRRSGRPTEIRRRR